MHPGFVTHEAQNKVQSSQPRDVPGFVSRLNQRATSEQSKFRIQVSTNSLGLSQLQSDHTSDRESKYNTTLIRQRNESIALTTIYAERCETQSHAFFMSRQNSTIMLQLRENNCRPDQSLTLRRPRCTSSLSPERGLGGWCVGLFGGEVGVKSAVVWFR